MARLGNNQVSIRKLNFVGSKTYAVSLPINIIRMLGWKKGNALFVRRQGSKIIIEKTLEEK